MLRCNIICRSEKYWKKKSVCSLIFLLASQFIFDSFLEQMYFEVVALPYLLGAFCAAPFFPATSSLDVDP